MLNTHSSDQLQLSAGLLKYQWQQANMLIVPDLLIYRGCQHHFSAVWAEIWPDNYSIHYIRVQTYWFYLFLVCRQGRCPWRARLCLFELGCARCLFFKFSFMSNIIYYNKILKREYGTARNLKCNMHTWIGHYGMKQHKHIIVWNQLAEFYLVYVILQHHTRNAAEEHRC